MGRTEHHPAAIKAVILASQAAVVAFFLLPILAIIYGETSSWVENRHLREEEVLNAEQWRKAVHEWNEGAQMRQKAMWEMERMKAEARAAQQVARDAR